MKKKRPIAPVRATGRGMVAVHESLIVKVWPGAAGRGRGTASTVWSSGLPSSGAMKRRPLVTSTGPSAETTTIDETSIVERSRRGSQRPGDNAASLMNVEFLSLQAFQ